MKASDNRQADLMVSILNLLMEKCTDYSVDEYGFGYTPVNGKKQVEISMLDGEDITTDPEDVNNTLQEIFEHLSKTKIEWRGDRRHKDTQIYKQYDRDTQMCIISEEEEKYIQDKCHEMNGHPCKLNDKANGYIAYSCPFVDQFEDDDWGFALVDNLNDICRCHKEKPMWYLGDPREEYVYVE